ncbi:hypothetical protein FOPE_01466 [Fonsecaea pedrosoi]|nr:hypothetical protein FOPE_01466 [Fonsecaea pedrosoi]
MPLGSLLTDTPQRLRRPMAAERSHHPQSKLLGVAVVFVPLQPATVLRTRETTNAGCGFSRDSSSPFYVVGTSVRRDLQVQGAAEECTEARGEYG